MAVTNSASPTEPTESAEPAAPGAHAVASIDAALTAFLSALDVDRAAGEHPARLCVALSGGRDSVVLLHALSRSLASQPYPVALSALHVNHGISPEADAWAAFCSEFCARRAVPLAVVRVDVPRASGEGLEAAARRARHAAFARCDANWLALAHHRDDQAETVLLNLLRGAGVAGAAGMRAQRAQSVGQVGDGPSLLRPLLNLPRALIEDYARVHGLAWVEDESNADAHYRRNYLRHEVMPRLRAVFPQAERSLARAAAHFAEGAQLLDELAAVDRAALAGASGRLDLTGFNALAASNAPRARNLLRFVWLAAGFRAPDTRWIDEALRQLASADADSETCLMTPDGALHVYRGELHIVGHAPEVSDVVLPWSGEPELPWAGGRVVFVAHAGSGLDRRLLQGGELALRPRRGGERLQPDPRRPRRSLRKLFQEAAIPPWERAWLPLLWVGQTLVWVGGVGVDAAFACAPGEAGVLPVWQADLPL